MRITSVFVAAFLAVLGSTQIAAAQKEIRISYVTSTLSPQSYQAHEFAEQIEKRLPGVFTFKFYPNGQLSSESDVIQNLELGSFEMAVAASGALNVDHKLGLFDLPWLFSDREHARKVFNGPLPGQVAELMESRAQIQVLGIYENGFRNIMSRREIVTPEDMKGLKIRISGGPTRREVFKTLGANPTPINWGEVFTSLQTGVVDGVEAGTYGLYEAKFYEVVPNFSITNHNFEPSFLVASRSFWQALTPEQQQVFTEVSKGMIAWAFDSAEKNEKDYFEKLKDVCKINHADIGSLQAAVAPIYKKYTDEYGSDWLDMIRAAQ